MKNFSPDWWKTLFDEFYLISDARSVCDDRITCREVDLIEALLKPKKHFPILDLCGGHGRHSLELGRRGFENLTVLDYSRHLIDKGRAMAEREGFNILFVQSDARATDFPDESFRNIIIMASSFGYFLNDHENHKVIAEAFRVLTPGGSLLLDLPDRNHVVNKFIPSSWHEADGEFIVCRKRTLDRNVVYSREVILSKNTGLVRDKSYCVRLYSPKEIKLLLEYVGFRGITVKKGFTVHGEPGDYGILDNRMIVLAHKE